MLEIFQSVNILEQAYIDFDCFFDEFKQEDNGLFNFDNRYDTLYDVKRCLINALETFKAHGYKVDITYDT